MKTTLEIHGMHCAGCARSIERSLRQVNGVQDVVVDLNAKRAVVTHHSFVGINDIVNRVNDMGFQASSVQHKNSAGDH